MYNYVHVYIIQISDADSVDSLHSVMMDNIDLLYECGFTKPVTRIDPNDKVDIIQTVSLHLVVLHTMGEITQFQDGLDCLGVKEALSSYRQLL